MTYQLFIQRLWDSLPTVQALVVSGADAAARAAVHLPDADATALVEALHRACFSNATPADSKKAALEVLSAEVQPHHVRDFVWLQWFVSHIVTDKWFDPSITSGPAVEKATKAALQARAAAVAAAGSDEEAIAAASLSNLTPTEDQLKNVVDCVIDDREPFALLPYDQVLTVSNKPLEVSSPFRLLVPLTVYPDFEEVYSRMWQYVVGRSTVHDLHPSDPIFKQHISQESFAKWFAFFYRLQIENATPCRAREAAKEEWFSPLRSKANDEMTFHDFISAAKSFAARYGKVAWDQTESYFEKIIAFVEANHYLTRAKDHGTPFFQTEVASCPLINKITLVNSRSVSVPDELDADRCEEAYFQQPTGNRVLVTGPSGVGKSQIAHALARKIGAVYVDVFQSAVEVIDLHDQQNTSNQQHQHQHHHHHHHKDIAESLLAAVSTGSSVPLAVRARLVARVLTKPATRHLGYVMDDLPTHDKKALNEFYANCGINAPGDVPQNIVQIFSTESVTNALSEQVKQQRLEKREADLKRRRDEDAAAAAVEAAKAARAAKRAAKAARAERKARIEAGEIQATEEDSQPEPEDAEEDLEEPPELDDEGNPMEPEAVALRQAQIAKTRARRILLEDLEHILQPHREFHATPDVLQMASLKRVVRYCTARRRIIEVGAVSDPDVAASHIVKRLTLAISVAPTEIPLPEDTPENPDGSAENDLAIAEAKLRFVTENTAVSFSKWKKLCPVTFAEHRVLIEGSMAFSVTYRGRAYCFTSKEYMQKFIASPHQYLTQRVGCVQPLLIMKSTLDVVNAPDSQVHCHALENQLAKALGLTLNEFGLFCDKWRLQCEETDKRTSIRAARSTMDSKTRAAREDRLKKRLEAEAKKKKKDTDKKKPAAKKKGEEDAAPAAEDAAPAAAEEVVDVPVVETTDDRLRKLIDAEKLRGESFCPLMVSILEHFDEEAFNVLFEKRVLPPTVVVLNRDEPRPEGEEAEEEEAADEEPEEVPADDAADEVDENGNPKPKPPPRPKIFDPTDPKQYKRKMRKIIAELQRSTEASGTEPEPPAEGEAPKRPFQAFSIIQVNTFGRTTKQLVDDISLLVHPLATVATPPQEGEEITQDPEPEEGDNRNPLLIPGPKAINQFGASLRYCPVSLQEKGVLIQGDPSLWLSFKGKKYAFATPEALAAFQRNPVPYVTNVTARVPPRLWIVGVPKSGKRTTAKALSKDHNIPLFWFDIAFFENVLNAALSDTGSNVDGVDIPSAKNNPFVLKANAVSEALKSFDADQQRRIALKERTQKEQAERDEKRDAGEELDDLDEEEEAEIQAILEFEPEEVEVRDERLAKAYRQMAAALMHVEPFESHGYIMIGKPNSEAEANGLLDEGAYPDAVLSIKVSSETFVQRHLTEEYESKKALRDSKQAAVEEKRKEIQRKQRDIELRKWRRRNIGGDDDVQEEVEEAPEDMEPVTIDGVRGELEALYETESSNVAAVVSALPDRRVPCMEVSGDGGCEKLLATTRDQLHRIIVCRRSMFNAVQVATYTEALDAIATGLKMPSVFGSYDPVFLADDRCGDPYRLKLKPSGQFVEAEEEFPVEPPPPPKEKRFRKVTKTNEDGEEYEVEEEEPDEEPEAAEPEPEPEPLEPEPEFSPEELDEMRKEHEERKLAAAKKHHPRAAYLGHRVYFFSSERNLLRFVLNPLLYWDQLPPLPEIDGAVVSVLEPTFDIHGSEKPRTMAEQLAYNINALYINVPKLLQWTSLQPRLGALQKSAISTLTRGQVPTPLEVADMLVHRIKSADALMRGAVLENLPRELVQLGSLYDAGLNISKCFVVSGVLQAAAERVKERAAVVHQLQEKPHTVAALREMVTETRLSIHRQREYVMRASLGFPASVHHTPTREADIRARRSQYLWYCPYMWLRHEQLVEIPDDRRYVVEYLGRFFCMSNQEFFQEFLVHPEVVSGESLSYANPDASVKSLNLPTTLPVRVPADVAPTKADRLELAGCCPVTLYNSRFRVGLRGVAEPIAKKGDSTNFVVEYDEKYYALLDDSCLTAFLRQPWVFSKYAVLPSPDKLPFDEHKLVNATHEEYMKRTMKEAVAHAMLSVSKERPKYPGLSAQESALKYMALYLKAHNPKNTDVAQVQYQHNFERFAKEATLYKTITTDAPSEPEALERFHEMCHAWDRLQDHPDAYKSYVHLRRNHDALPE